MRSSDRTDALVARIPDRLRRRPLDLTPAMRRAPASRGHVPGEPGLWVLILGEMTTFGALFIIFMFYRAQDLELYRQSRLLLNQHLGAINTLLLLASSWLVVLALEAARAGRVRSMRPLLGGAFLCGVGFACIKIVEYTEKIGAGITIGVNDFFAFYFLLTGFHFLHLLLGMGVLVFMMHLARRKKLGQREIGWLEGSACFWHMVDLLWIVLFPLLYLA